MMGYNPQERHVLFELIEEAMATVYENGRPKSQWGAG